MTEWVAIKIKQKGYWVTAGDTPAEIVQNYCAATGTVPYEIIKEYIFIREKLKPYIPSLMKHAHRSVNPVMSAFL